MGDHYSKELLHTMKSTDPSAVLEHGTYVRPPEALPEDGWGRGRASLLGDAAHPLRPTGEQLQGQPCSTPWCPQVGSQKGTGSSTTLLVLGCGKGCAIMLRNAASGPADRQPKSCEAASLGESRYTACYGWGKKVRGLLGPTHVQSQCGSTSESSRQCHAP